MLEVTFVISKVLFWKSAAVKLVTPPPGNVTEENVTYSFASIVWEARVTVTVEDPVVELKDAVPGSVSNGVIS